MRFDREMVEFIDANGEVKEFKQDQKGSKYLTALYHIMSFQRPYPILSMFKDRNEDVYHAHNVFVAGGAPTFRERVQWGLSMIISLFTRSPYVYMMSWMMVYTLANHPERKRFRVCLGVGRLWYMITKFKVKNPKAFVGLVLEEGHPIASHFEYEILGL